MFKQGKRILAISMAAFVSFQSVVPVQAEETRIVTEIEDEQTQGEEVTNGESEKAPEESLLEESEQEDNKDVQKEEEVVNNEEALEKEEASEEELTALVDEAGEESKQSTVIEAEAGDYVFDLTDLEIATRWGAKETINEDGKLHVTYDGKYPHIFFKLPEGLDPRRIESVSVDAEPDKLAVKFCKNDNDKTELAVAYNQATLSKDALKNGVSASDIELVDFMAMLSSEDGHLEKDFGKLTFKLSDEIKDEPVEEDGEKKELAAGTYKFNVEDLEIESLSSASAELTDDGLVVNYNGQYAKVNFLIPEDIEAARIKKVSVDTTSTECSLKIMEKSGDDNTIAKVVYGTNSIEFTGTEDHLADSKILQVMNLRDGAATRTIKSVSFVIGEAIYVDPNAPFEGDLTLNCFKEAGNVNPIVTQRYSADPGVMVYDDTVYIFSTNDVYEYQGKKVGENTYSKINTLNLYSSKDLVNWTDHGAIPVAGKNNSEGPAKWANNSWAPAAAHKTINGKEKFFLYFADNGSGVGVLTADSPLGPWTDPIGKQLISRQTPTCANITWLFDPAVMVDDDGTGYLVFGGGVPNGQAAHPMNARVVKLGDDMISLAGDPVTIDAPYLFEDSGINKIGDKYVYSYCSNWNCQAPFRSGTIQYMIADDPMGPYEYVGEIFANPSSFFNDGNGNNHHSLFEFKGKYYIAYHARALERAALGRAEGYRTTQIDEFTLSNGKINTIKATMKGVEQVTKLNPYVTNNAATIYRQKGIEVTGHGNDAVINVTAGDFTSVKGADFTYGLSTMTMSIKAKQDMTVEVRTGSESGDVIGTFTVKASDSFNNVTADMKNVTGAKDIYFIYSGEAVVRSWKAEAGTIFKFNELTEVESYNLEKSIDENGAITINYTKQYGEIRYELPASIDPEKVDKIVVKLSEGKTSDISIKALPAFGGEIKELAVAYNNTTLDTSSIDKDNFKYFGIMGMDKNGCSVKLDSVQFVMESDEIVNPGIEMDIPNLRDAITDVMGKDFIVGAAITGNEISDAKLMALVTKHFNAVTFGNELKPDALLNKTIQTVELNGEMIEVPSLRFNSPENMLNKIRTWNKKHPDQFIKVRGHVLTWHSQTPEWFFHENYDESKPVVSPEVMNKRHEWYIKSVLEHFVGEDSKYKDMFYGWDVVNEACSDETGTYRSDKEKSSWWKVYHSQEFIINAFRFANKYAPADLELYYNDYSECDAKKIPAIEQLLKDVKNAEGTRIDGMGMQGHYHTTDYPSIDDFKKAARTYGSIVDKLQVTELDFQCSHDYDGTSKTYDDEDLKLANRYKEFYDAMQELETEGIDFTNITVWGTIDRNSWLQNASFVGGGADGNKKQMPLLFNDNYKVKLAYWAFVDPTKVKAAPKKFDLVQSAAGEDIYSNGVSLSFAGEQISAIAKPVWDGNNVYVQVTVADKTKDSTDKVMVYLSQNGKIQRKVVARTAAKETENGYVATVRFACADKSLVTSAQLRMDFVVEDKAEKIAYNDNSFSQDSSDVDYAIATVKPCFFITKGTVTVDGDADEAWENATQTSLTINAGAKATANAKLLWDEDNLYAYVVVKDAVLNADNSQAHEKDSLELFIDENNHKKTSYEDDDKQYRINYKNEQSFNGKKCVAENIKSAVKVTEDGYIVEVAAAWTDITPAVGSMIGLELQINDADASGKRIGTLNWSDDSGNCWQNTSKFGTATLVDQIGEIQVKADIEWELPELRDSVAERLGNDFLIGATIGGKTIDDENIMALVTKHFNAVSIENELKPDALFGYVKENPATETITFNGQELVVPVLDYSRAEKILNKIYDWNQKNPDKFIKVRGHVLTWHSQTPDWFFRVDYDTNKGLVSKDEMSIRHEWFIKTVLEHFTGEDSKYKGMFYGWDVVNEAISDNRQTYRNESENSMWWRVYGSQEFIINAFRFANKYAPADLELYYNDYSECSEGKSKGICQLLTDVKNAEGTRIDAMGMQSHHSTNEGSPSMDQFKAAVMKYTAIVGKVQLTELDFTTSNSYDGSVSKYDAENTRLAYRYKEFYDTIAELRADGVQISAATIWGTIDKFSWLQDNGRQPKQIPMLFDDDYRAKPAFWAFVDPTKLEPKVKNIEVIQSTDGSFKNATVYSFEGKNTKAGIAPVWNEAGLRIQVAVDDATEDVNDKIVIYLGTNKGTSKVEVERSAATKTETGYVAVVDVEMENLNVNTDLAIDFVIVNGDEKIAFNDYRFTQEASSKYYAKALIKPYLGINKGTAVIDGELDEIFAKVAPTPLKISAGAKAEASFRALWDNEYLYTFIEVKDAKLDDGNSSAHEKDSVEIFVDENNHKTTSYEDDDKQYRVNYKNVQTFNGKKCVADNITSVAKVTETGYIIEAAIKWTDITPANNTKVGFEVQINDAEGGRRIGTLNWYDTSGNCYQNTSMFGTITLNDTEETVDPTPEEPTPEEPTPVEPIPVVPTPVAPTPAAQAEEAEVSAPVVAAAPTNVVEMIAANVDDEAAAVDMMTVKLDHTKILKMKTFELYHSQGILATMNIGEGVGVTLFTNEVAGYSKDIDLRVKKSEMVDFAEGFTTYNYEFVKPQTLGFKLGLNMNLGTQFTDKIAYIFEYDADTKQFVNVGTMKVNEIGNVGYFSNKLSRTIILVTK